jgi:hypothetical protein
VTLVLISFPIVTFFLDKIVMDLKDLRSAAQSKLRALRSATKAQLMSFFSSRKAFTIDVDATVQHLPLHLHAGL